MNTIYLLKKLSKFANNMPKHVHTIKAIKHFRSKHIHIRYLIHSKIREIYQYFHILLRQYRTEDE